METFVPPQRPRTLVTATVVLVVSLLAVGTSSAANAGAGTISGVLYHDLNEDGVRNEGEPGLSGQPVDLLSDDEIMQASETGIEGEYAFNAPAGEYTVRADTDFRAFFCSDDFGSFDPLWFTECMTPKIPWAFTTEEEVNVVVQAGIGETIDFGARKMDAMLMAGRGYYQNGTPAGTILEAYVSGTKCGEAELMQKQGHNYELAVLGASEAPGCAVHGDEVTFIIGGIEAVARDCSDELCQPHPVFYQSTASTPIVQGLVAVEDYAIYWAQELAYPDIGVAPVEGVDVSIDGTCEDWPAGSIGLSSDFFGNNWVGTVANVPSNEIWPGCGYPGAEVHFTVTCFGCGETNTVATWEPGIYKIDLHIPRHAVGSGDVNCDREVDALDALAFLRELAALTSDTQCWLIADVNCDGTKDALDVLIILKYVAALPYELPAGCPPVNQAGP